MKKKRVYLKTFHRELKFTPIDMIYEHHVLPVRVRKIELLGNVCRARVQKTLLGYEVKMGRLRKNCPDLVTARYLKVFASLGLASVYIPYNPVHTAKIVPILERSFHEINRKINKIASIATNPIKHFYYRRRIYHFFAERIKEVENNNDKTVVNN